MHRGDLMGKKSKGEGIYAYVRLIHFTIQQKLTQAPLVAQMAKKWPAVQETWVLSLGGEDPLEKEMAALSTILAWRIPWTEEPGGLQSTGSQSDTTE